MKYYETQLPTANKAKQLADEQRELETTAVINKIMVGINKNIAQGYSSYQAKLTGRQYHLACNFIHMHLADELGYRVTVGLGGVQISWD